MVFVLYLLPGVALAIVLRPGVPDSKYVVSGTAFPALADLPGEGQGTLIASRWVVTAAHATQGYTLGTVRIAGMWRKVSRVFLYPGFKEEYDKVKLAAEHPTLGSWPGIKSAMESMHDIALVELAEPVEDVRPVALYLASNERGTIVKLFGKGATGNGKVGEYPHSPHRGQLRRAYNRVAKAHAQWLDYRFACGTGALPLEGVLGDDDSGGPVLIRAGGEWKLAGLADWKHWPKDSPVFEAGVCGQVFSNSRISYYAQWIHRVMATHASDVKS